MEQIIELVQRTFQAAMLISAPILLAAMFVSMLISLAQVLTSMQEMTLATVPRLAAVATIAVLLAPWMTRRMIMFTTQLFADFHVYIR